MSFEPKPSSNLFKRFFRETDGTTMVEFALAISLFLLILFAILDFSRLGYNWVVAEKGMQRAARIAAVRPPVCDDVPSVHLLASGTGSNFRPGDLCSTGGGICAAVTRTCRLDDEFATTDTAAKGTADEIWAVLEVLLPQGATRNNVQITYAYDPRLGFVGGPYIPLITTELVASEAGPNCGGELCFTFVTPLSALAAVAGDAGDIPASIPFPGISVTLPAEDLNQGMAG
jgi:hypothetical protein